MLGCVFPGQGSQKVGMGKGLADAFHEAAEVFNQADDILGFSLSKLCFEGPEEELKLTANAQPAILTTSVATWRVLEKQSGVRAAAAAGHSLGEYSALVCAGAISFEDALRTVRQRGNFMQEAVPVGKGGMAAVQGMDRVDVEKLCQDASRGNVLSPANYNSPRQIVITGDAEAVQRAVELAKERGARAIRLPVSAPFHSSLMEAAAAKLAEALAGVNFAEPKLPVVSNVAAEPYSGAANIAELLVKQVTSPVLWSDSVLKLKDLGIEEFMEVGPGNVLTKLIKQIDKTLRCRNIESREQVDELSGKTTKEIEEPTWEKRKKELMAAGYTLEREDMLKSRDGMHCVFENGMEWNARDPGACGF